MVRGGNGLVDGKAVPERLPEVMEKVKQQGFANKKQVIHFHFSVENTRKYVNIKICCPVEVSLKHISFVCLLYGLHHIYADFFLAKYLYTVS